MKKVVRLTENDLARIVKRVIKESTKPTFPMFIKLLPKEHQSDELDMFIQEYTNLGYYTSTSAPILVNVVSKNKSISQGCIFDFYVKGGTKRGNFEIRCDGSDIRVFFNSNKATIISLYFDASKQAMTELKTACGCQAYVSNQNKDTEQPGGNSYV
jgi:hypothetical protein